jgi:L-threonylcarbamoyladenylate synthase
MAEIIEFEAAELKDIAKRVCSGQVFIYPTDTVYGIGCNAMDEKSVKRVFEVKKKEKNKPLSVAFADFPMLVDYVDMEGKFAELREKLPGPYTFIIKNRGIPKIVTGGRDTVGCRIPDYPKLLELIKRAGVPIVTSSANLSGDNAACEINELPCEVIDKVDFILDAGKKGSGKASKVINLSDGKILR